MAKDPPDSLDDPFDLQEAEEVDEAEGGRAPEATGGSATGGSATGGSAAGGSAAELPKTGLPNSGLPRAGRRKGRLAEAGPSPAPAPRSAHGMDHEKLVRAARLILEGIGEDPDREGLRETPERMARMYEEVFAGLHSDPGQSIKTIFTEKYDEIVLVKDIPFASMCEHHLLPFIGKAHAAYIPSGKVLGISKLARAVEIYARRPQVQERLTNQVADLILAIAEPKGVAVIVEASHTCMTIRGIRKPGSYVITSALRGYFRKNIATRNELMNLIRSHNS